MPERKTAADMDANVSPPMTRNETGHPTLNGAGDADVEGVLAAALETEEERRIVASGPRLRTVWRPAHAPVNRDYPRGGQRAHVLTAPH